jgi:serine/threonine protein kinase
LQPAKNCETCGKPVAGDAPSGVCPSCLLRTAIEYGASRAVAPLLPSLRYFGDYELLEEVARGGQGVVYRARQVSLERIVAIKMMQPGLLATEAEIGRFYVEARTAARLQHPNIVAIHEVGEFDGLHYFSMDFVEGPSLAEVVRQGAVSSEEAARYLLILAETVEYAHAKGVLHRDLKPSNVLLDGAGRPRVTDFGLARPLHGDADGTAMGTVIGTPAYMSPEQAAGRNDLLSAASDVYSLGAILYELLTGRPPFHGASQMETVRMVLEQEPVPPRELNPSVDRRLEAICLRCLAKEPANRCQTAAELAAYLRRSLRIEHVALASLRHHLTLPAAAILVALAILAVVFSTLRTGPSKPKPPARSVVRPDAANPRPSPATPAPVPNAKAAVAAAARPRPVPETVIPAAIPAKPAPVAVSVSPEQGVGYRQEFTFRYSDPRGAAAIRTAEVDFHDPQAVGSRRCAIMVEPEEGRVRLQFYPDRAPGVTVSGTLGTLAELENSVCSVDLTGLTVRRQGNDLDLRLTVTFKPSFDGPKEIGSWPWDKPGSRGESHVHGQWVVGNKTAAPL